MRVVSQKERLPVFEAWSYLQATPHPGSACGKQGGGHGPVRDHLRGRVDRDRRRAIAQTPVERGAYLVDAVMACDRCHTPRDKQGFVMAKRFSDGSQVWNTPVYTVRGTNITPDPETGIGAWSDDEIKCSITDGVSRDGRAFELPMARQDYFSRMSGADLDALVAWMRTIPPIE